WPAAASRCWRSRTGSPWWWSRRTAAPVIEAGTSVLTSSDEFGQVLEELTLALGPDEALHRRAVLEDQQRRDAHDVEAAGRVGVVVDVELGHGQLALVLRRDLLEGGGDHLARPAPLGPEVDDHRALGALHRLVEGGVGECQNLVRHGMSFRGGRPGRRGGRS